MEKAHGMQNEIIFLLFVMFSIMLFSLSCSAQAASLYVDVAACPGPGTGTAGDPFCSIQHAIDQATSGDDVLVVAGTYDEVLVMKSGVDVLAAGATAPQIYPISITTSINMILFDGVDDVTFDGFILNATGGAGIASGKGIFKMDCATNSSCLNIAVSNCELIGDPFFYSPKGSVGFTLDGEMELTIADNTIYNNCFAGIGAGGLGGHYLINSTLTITGNTIYDNGAAGIYLVGNGTGNRVIIGQNGVNGGNSLTNNGYREYFGTSAGIRLNGVDQASIENNNITTSNGAGINFISVSTVAPHISNNDIHANNQAGINIGGASQVTIGSNNNIYDNVHAGISFFAETNSNFNSVPASSLPVSITGNAIYGNGLAGVAIIDHVTGTVTVDGNDIYQNTKAGIGIFNAADVLIQNNEIHTHTTAAGIFTGDWSGTYPPDPAAPPSSMSFDRTNGPANLTIRMNKIYGNRSGMRLDHASGTISNNLVHDNTKAGIRFSGNNISPYAPFAASWGITSLTNNTMADNGTATDIYDVDSNYLYTERRGGGMAYDDINDTAGRTFFDPPVKNIDQGPTTIENNIAAYNAAAGIRESSCSSARDYNLYYSNNGTITGVRPQTSGCSNGTGPNFTGNPNEIFDDPLFVDRVDYQLLFGSPAINSGSDGLDMGAYGGSTPLTW